MAKDYSALTGDEMLAGIRKTHRARIAGDIFLILFAAAIQYHTPVLRSILVMLTSTIRYT